LIRAKVLVIDDEPHIRRLLRSTLERSNYDVAEAADAKEAMLALAHNPDIVLLDLGLPDRDGLELIPLIRRNSKATLLVISAREATEQKVTALDLSADDYVTKPFDTEELLARMRAASRNRMSAGGAQLVVKVADVAIDLVNRRVHKGAEEVHLTPKEYEVLVELARFPGRVITHAQLLKSVWANEYERHIEYLRVVIRNLRQKIEDDVSRPAIVVNELGVGYRLMGAEG